MIISVKGKKSPLTKSQTVKAVQFFTDCLMTKRLSKNVEVVFVYKKLLESNGASGFCSYEDSNINPRIFEIEIDCTMSKEETLKTLAHELVHLKQYAKGELKQRYRPRHHHLWHNEIVTVNDTNFHDVPWELEAVKLEDELYKKLML